MPRVVTLGAHMEMGEVVGAIFAQPATGISSILEGWLSGKASWNRATFNWTPAF